MYERFEKIYEKKDKLSREVFLFVLLNDLKITLDGYSIQSRPSTRHKYQIDESYNRLMRRESTLKPENIEVSDFIINEVKKEIFEKLTYTLTLNGEIKK